MTCLHFCPPHQQDPISTLQNTMSATPCIRISPALAVRSDRSFMHGRTQHRLQRTPTTQYEPESRDIIFARPQLGTSNVPAADYSSTNGLSSHRLQPQVEAPSILDEHNTTLALALTRHEEGLLAFCEAAALAESSHQRLPSPACTPNPLAYTLSSLPQPPSALAGSFPLQEDELCRECPGAPILDDPDPPYDYGTHPLDMVPLFPRRHPDATALRGINTAAPSWVRPSSSVQTTSSTATGRRSLASIATSPSVSGARLPGHGRRRGSPASAEMSSLLREADSVPLFPSARPRASRGPCSPYRRDV